MADILSTLTRVLTNTEADNAQSSGEMGLEQTIDDIRTASHNLRQGVFRLLVLGDMKRGKSTFLNALIGENLLPSDVSPCTALLAEAYAYGPEKKVTVHFVDVRAAEAVDFTEFKQRYTYEKSIIERIDQDIASRKAELDNLVKQKETSAINRDTETRRLKAVQAGVDSACQQLESVYQYLLAVE